MKQKRLQYKIAVWLTMGLMIVDPLVVPFVYAENPIEIDRNAPHERQAMIGQAANGVTLVNVVGPSAGGVSRNDYTNFNVPQNGVILNNSYQMSNTKLGGYVPGNTNMMRGSANVIVNEVTSHNPTNMNGFIEVAGHKASVVIANPNGITVDGAGFINTDRAVLTTGKPEYDSLGNLNSYRVERGTVAINRNGLNAKEANSLQILTEAASVNAGIWANSIEVRTGKNKIDANTLDTQKIGNSNNIGLDVSAIGGMYANSITLKGTNTGLGVNVKGVVSSTQASSITSDGKIIVDGGVTSNGNTTLAGQSIAINNNGVVQGDVSTTVNSKETVNNRGLINSGKTTTINAKSVDNHEGGRIYGDTVAIDANTVMNHTNSEIEQRYHKAGKDLEKAKNDLDAEWNADISKYKTKPELDAHRQRINDLTKAYDDVQEKVTALKTELDSHKSGVIAGRNHVNITSDTIDNTGKGLIYSGGTMDLIAKDGIHNKGATIKATKSIKLDAPTVENNNVALGTKRVSDGITKNPDKIKVTHPNHKLEGQVFDKSEFPYADDSSGYGTPHVKPVKTPEDEAYNKEMNKNENRINQFTIIRSEAEQTHKKVTNDDPGIISSGGDLVTIGILYNDNSRVISGGTVETKGSIQNISDMISDKTFITGTTQESRTEKKRKRHGYRSKRIRVWGPEVFMTPSITEENVKPIGTLKEHAEDKVSKATIAKVNDSLDPYGLGGGKGKASQTINGLSLPTEALYQIHPDITANALIETDPAFTNRKNFLSSQFMIDALANNPERRFKRLGDGFYEQQLINEQIVSATGKQYLEGYTDNEAEYKALLEAGIAFGKAFKLAPGIALSKEQMEAITTDMVWLETKTVVVDGKAQQVLYPKVYLAKQPAKSVDAMGGIISGKAIVSNTNADILNQGIMTADTIVLGANDVENTGRIDGRKVTIKASQDVINTGNIHGEKQVTINVGRDINVGAHVNRLEHHDIVSRQGTIGVAKDGDLVLSAKRDVNLKGAIVHTGDNSKATIEAGQNINLTTEALSAKKDMTVNSENYNRTDRRTELGTAILSDSHVNLHAGNDVNIRSGIVNSEYGVTSVEAGNDVTITNGNSYSRDEYGLKYKEKSLLSRTTNIIRTDHEHTGVLSSTIGGDTINVKANRNVSVSGSNILGTKDVSVSAGNDVRTDSGEETQRDDVYQYSKKSGLMGAGIGFTIGSKKVTDTLEGNSKTNVNTLIGSANGKISIDANNKAHLTSTDIIGKDDIEVSASDITLDGKHDTVASKQVHEEKQSGLTVSLGGSIASALTTARGLQRKANSRNDKRLGALESLEAGKELKKGYSKIQEYKNFTPDFVRDEAQKSIASGILKEQKVKEIDSLLQNNKLTDKTRKALEKERKRLAKEASYEKAKGYNDLNDINGDQKQYRENKRAKKDGLANIHVSVGSSKSRSESRLDSSKYAGGHIVSDNGIKLVTKPTTADSGDIVAIGETIRGESVELDASRNLSLQAGTNTTTITDKYDSKGWSIGANLSVNGGGLLGIDANYNKANENGTTVKRTHLGTVVQGNKVITNSGADTAIVGSKVYGDSIQSKIGGNLTIKSLQDSETYRGEKKNVGFSISTNGTKLGGVSAEYSKGKMTSDYASVTEQAGLYAGAEGFNITTKGNTTLEGAVIDSKAKADKNKLSTNSLTVKDIKNKAEYKSSNTGLSYTSVSGFKNLSQAGKDAVYNSLGLLPKLLPDSKKTVESTTKSVIANGTITTESSNIDINKISKDTKNSLNKLDTIFDKKKVEERQELARLFAKDAFEQLHYWDPKTKEGKAAKALAHAVVAETSARIAGNPKGSGFYAGATNEALIGEIQKIAKSNPAVAQWLSASLGALVNHGLGKSPITGATEAQYGTKYNRFYKRRATIPVAGYIKKKDQETLNMYGLGIKKSYNGISENVSTDSEENESYVGAPYIVSTWADADTGLAYHTLSDGTVQPMNKTWGKVLEGRGYPTALGNDGKFYTGSDQVGWYYNSDPSEESRKRVVATGYQDSDGQLIQYHADKTITRTGDFLGNKYLREGYKPEWVGSESNGYWTANNWYVNLDSEARKIISESISGGVGNSNKVALDAFKWSTSKVGRDLSLLSTGKEESASVFLVGAATRRGNSPNSIIYTDKIGYGYNLTDFLKKLDFIAPPKIVYNNDPADFTIDSSYGGYSKKSVPSDNSDVDLKHPHFKLSHTDLEIRGVDNFKFKQNNTIDVKISLLDFYQKLKSGNLLSIKSPTYDSSNSNFVSLPLEFNAEVYSSREEEGPIDSESLGLVNKVYSGLPIETIRAEGYLATHPDTNATQWTNKGNGRDYIVEEENGKYKILFDQGWKDITKYDLERYYKRKSN